LFGFLIGGLESRFLNSFSFLSLFCFYIFNYFLFSLVVGYCVFNEALLSCFQLCV
jgi:hypothetical protein